MYDEVFSECFSPEYIKNIYETKIRFSAGVGIDRLTWRDFEKNQPNYYEIISEKILNGTYGFSPYLEKLVSKGRNKYPRIISLPTIRDKVTLTIINRYLQNEFSECISRILPNQRIKRIIQFIETCPESLSIVRTDFSNFYGSVEHSILLSRLKNIDVHIFSLIYKAITNPTVPLNTPRKERENFIQRLGIPQGLPISNILAEIYIHDFDTVIENKCIFYDRYIDDIIAFTEDPLTLLEVMEKGFSKVCLSFNRDKTSIKNVNDNTIYLGYSVSKKNISVRKSNFERLLSSLDRIFAIYKTERKRIKSETKEKKSEEYKNKVQLLKDNLVEDVNIKIAGAYYEDKRYGWIFYFSEINDLSLLYRIDAYIEKKFKALKLVGTYKNIKKISRAYFRIKEGTTANYSHDFNLTKKKDMLKILTARGMVHEWETLNVKEIRARYHKYVSRKLSELDEDLGKVY
jgi:hypothetical protein